MLGLLKPYLGPVALFAFERALNASPVGVSQFWSGAILSFAAFWFLFSLVSHKALVKRFPKIREWLPFVDPTGATLATSKDLTGKYVSQAHFAIADLARNNKIQDRVFEDCDVYGPAVLYVSGPASMIVDCGFDAPRELVFIGTDQAAVVGPIHIENCSFRHCRFHGVGIIGPVAAIKQAIAANPHL